MQDDENTGDPWAWLSNVVDWFWGLMAGIGVVAFAIAVGLYCSCFFHWIAEKAAK